MTAILHFSIFDPYQETGTDTDQRDFCQTSAAENICVTKGQEDTNSVSTLAPYERYYIDSKFVQLHLLFCTS